MNVSLHARCRKCSRTTNTPPIPDNNSPSSTCLLVPSALLREDKASEEPASPGTARPRVPRLDHDATKLKSHHDLTSLLEHDLRANVPRLSRGKAGFRLFKSCSERKTAPRLRDHLLR